MNLNWGQFRHYCNLLGREAYTKKITKYENLIHTETVDSYDFFLVLGFKDVKALDISEYEGANIIFDLNSSDIYPEICNRFDYIVDGGTFEHVFNIPNAFINITKMLKVGGKIIHWVPANNFINHGFYSFSPTLFIDYYEANNFFVENVQLIFYRNDDDMSYENHRYLGFLSAVDWRISTHSGYSDFNMLSQDNTFVILECIAVKRDNSTVGVVPIQGAYEKIYKNYDENKLVENKLDEVFGKHSKQSIAIYGTGEMADLIVNYLDKHKIYKDKVLGFMDRDIVLTDKNYKGFKMISIEKSISEKIECIVIASKGHEEDIYLRLKYLEEANIKLIRILEK